MKKNNSETLKIPRVHPNQCEHALEFFDSCPNIEVFECKKCKIKKFVSDDGRIEWKEGEI